MKTNHFYLTITAITGLVVGSAWARAQQLDEMTAILRKANKEVETSLASRAVRHRQASTVSSQVDAVQSRAHSEKRDKVAPTSRIIVKTRDTMGLPLITDSIRHNKIILYDSVQLSTPTSSVDTGRLYSFLKSKRR
jgi:hypothetical protein